ncbi:autophagy-related protein 27 [Geopyxis carbonaria]|nr:autophagy-related protein 27 [Geopyxis carbonaria]
MRLSPSPYSAAATALLLLPFADANSWNCESVVTVGKDKLKYNFHSLGGVHELMTSVAGDPATKNTTWQINPCGPILKEKETEEKGKGCQHGTQVCGIVREIFEGKDPIISDVIPVAKQPVQIKTTRLKDSDSPEDRGKDGLRVKLSGSKYAHKIPQQAIIDFECDMNRTGLEKQKEQKEKKVKREEKEEGGEGEGEDDNDDKEVDIPEEDKASLQFIAYDQPGSGVHTLRLKWLTKWACEEVVRDPKKGEDGNKGGDGDNGDGGKADGGSHWGFFTWIFIIAFLGIAAYLIFGSWLNYNRYGERGWALLPHGDTIRDLPYLMKDFLRKIVSTIQGHGGRGGYSAV